MKGHSTAAQPRWPRRDRSPAASCLVTGHAVNGGHKLAANPCPCAKGAVTGTACSCTSAAKRRYLARLSGPLLDRVDVKVELLPVSAPNC